MPDENRSAINDGYVIRVRIPAKGPWQELNVWYRPMLPTDAAEFLDSNTKRGKERCQYIIKALLKQVTAWDMRKLNVATDETVPVTEEWLLRTPFAYLEDMMNAVLGYSTHDQVIDQKN